MKIAPIVSKQKYESVAEQIMLMIRDNTFSEGSYLPAEVELASMFQVGRSSVREAIKSLQIAGILASSAGNGTLVTDNAMIAIANYDLGELIMDESSLAELIELRCIIEPAAAALAALRRTDEDITRMRETVERMEGVTDKSKLLRLGHKFHSLLLSASKNRSMKQFHDSISLQLLKMRERDFLSSEIFIRDSSTHREILDAIINRDERKAKELMLKHLETDYKDYIPQK